MITVWAPSATRVDLALGDERRPLEGPDERGRFTYPDALPPGTDYGFSLDGGPVRADPRSPWQPFGTAGPSRTVDHDAFGWTDDRWHGVALAGTVFYELHVGTFTPVGTFDAAIAHLDDLVALGVTTIELLPVVEFAGRRGWGYDGVLWYAPHHAYGGPDGLKRFVDAAHARGLGVVLDVVYNHLGPADCYLHEFGPYTHDAHHTPWGAAINLDGPGSDEVRRFIVDNALTWLRDYHLDGLRLDAVDALVDTSAVHVLEELSAAVRDLEAALRRPLTLVAETAQNDPRFSTPVEAGGLGLDAQWSDDLHHALHSVLTGERSGYYVDFGERAHVRDAVADVHVYAGRWSEHRGRHHGRPVPAGTPRRRFVVCSQNHDQVGNRARGDRLVHLTDVARAKLAAAVVLTSACTPLLFQGEEWGATAPFPWFADFEGDLADAVRQGRQDEFAHFGWSPDEIPDPLGVSTFESAVLDWSERTEGHHAELLDWYRTLLRLRRSVPALTADRTEARLDGEVLVVERGDDVLAAFNLGDGLARVAPPTDHEVLLASGWADPVLAPWGVAVFRLG